jgi:hypothetical protein
MRPLTRIPPAGPVQAYRTYAVAAPAATHWRRATCVEVECGAWARGWRTVLDMADAEQANRALYIRTMSGRRFTEARTGPSEVTFSFPPGQPCFRAAEHRVRTARPELYVVRAGDWRGNPTGWKRQHTRPEHWVEDFAENQDALRTRYERG